MRTILLAQERADFWVWVDDWANAASVAGFCLGLLSLIVALIGFPVTWKRQRDLAEATRKALDMAAHQVSVAGVEDIHRMLLQATEAIGRREWHRVFDWCTESRVQLIRLTGNPALSRTEASTLEDSVADMGMLLEYVRKQKLLKGNPSPVFKASYHNALERLVLTLTHIQARLSNAAWGYPHGRE